MSFFLPLLVIWVDFYGVGVSFMIYFSCNVGSECVEFYVSTIAGRMQLMLD